MKISQVLEAFIADSKSIINQNFAGDLMFSEISQELYNLRKEAKKLLKKIEK